MFLNRVFPQGIMGCLRVLVPKEVLLESISESKNPPGKQTQERCLVLDEMFSCQKKNGCKKYFVL